MQVLLTEPPAPPAAESETPFDGTQLPARLGHFRVERELVAGGMGVVYEAVDTRANRTVALKLLRSVLLMGEAEKARFRIEAETAARLEHPHIVRVYEVGEIHRQPYISMKLMEGGSLAQRLARPGLRIPPREAAGLVSKVAQAVQYAHQRGVLHRDLKPGNILFDTAGEPHLTDFGLAKLVDADSSLTISSAQLGTPHYMSPEQAAGRVREISTASDVWALGAILYQLLTGRVPFAGEGHAEIFRQILETEPPRFSSTEIRRTADGPAASGGFKSRLGNPVSADLETLCLRCLEKDPARRLASAGELAEELDRWLRGEPIRSRPITPLERAFKWVRRNKKLSVLTASLAGALLGGAVAATVLWRQAEAARNRADRNAASALEAERLASANAYFATVAHAFSARQQGDLGRARQLLAGLAPERRGFEWRLLQWLSRGDDVRRTGFDPAEPRCVAWEPVRQRLAVITDDRVLHWVDPATGAQESGITVPDPRAKHMRIAIDHGLHALSFSPDGRHFLAGDGDILIIAETDTGRLLHSTAGRRLNGVWLDDTQVLFAGNNVWGALGTAPAGIFDLAGGREEALPPDVCGPLALSPDRQRLAWSRDHPQGVRVEVLPASEFKAVAAKLAAPAQTLLLTNCSPALLAFSGDQRHLAVALGRQARTALGATVFSLASNAPVLNVELPAQIHALAFSPDEPVLAVATDDSTLRTFRLLESEPASRSYDDEAASGLAQPYGEDGPQLPPANLLSRSAAGGRYGFLLGHTERVRDLAFLPGASPLATVGSDGTLRRWPLAAAISKSRIGDVWSWNSWEHPAASVDGRFVLYRADTNRTWLWDRQSNRRIAYPESHYPLAVLRDGRAVTRHSLTGEIFVWEPTGDRSQPRELWHVRGIPSHPGFGQAVRGVVSRDERILVGLIPGKLLVVDLEHRTASGTDDQRMLYGPSGVNCVDVSPDGRLIAVTGFIGRRVRLYPADKVAGGFVSLGSAEDYDTAVAFHPDGRRLFVGNEDGWVRVYDVNTRQELPTERWRAQSGGVTALAVSSDGKVVTSSGDRTLAFWDALPGAGEIRRERLRMNTPVPRNWMRFAADDTVFIHIAPGHALEAWEAPAL
jgi:WD40 repeat protein